VANAYPHSFKQAKRQFGAVAPTLPTVIGACSPPTEWLREGEGSRQSLATRLDDRFSLCEQRGVAGSRRCYPRLPAAAFK
jgi:hypothetical protein